MKKVMKNIFLKLMFQYPENLNDLHNDIPFLPKRMKTEKFGKVVGNLHNKKI